ncbi:hypothetical protein QP104_03630 [Alloscardovia omnicolens]|nr:hypothetical protein [Alloscardovia omnicolens]MDK6445017.1 hypothetical protein [Alloscardovia omnicolens]PKY78326.1 hypothetical protein CYJ33_06310 [Alloscardovia omnicolens]
MLNSKISYPYPVVRYYPQDYQNTVFEGTLHVDGPTETYYEVVPEFNINNSQLEQQIRQGVLTYALQVVCSSTWYRELFFVKDNESIKIDSSNLHGKVEVVPCVITAEDINNFSNDDFDEGYQGISFSLRAGDVCAIGRSWYFTVLFERDIATSIMRVVRGSKKQQIRCDFESDIIEVQIPEESYEHYYVCGKDESKSNVLISIFTTNVIQEALSIMAKKENKYLGDSAWHKTISHKLEELSQREKVDKQVLLEDPLGTAQLLLGNNYIAALADLYGEDREAE